MTSKFPNRLNFDSNNNLIDNANNREILAKQPLKTEKYNPEGKSSSEFSAEEIINKFINYDGIGTFDFKDIDPKTNRKWYRYLKLIDDDYHFRSGGFIIENNTKDRYFVFLNPFRKGKMAACRCEKKFTLYHYP